MQRGTPRVRRQNWAPRSCSAPSAGRRASTARPLSAPTSRTSSGPLVFSRRPESLHSHLRGQKRRGGAREWLEVAASPWAARPRPDGMQGRRLALCLFHPRLPGRLLGSQPSVAPQGLAVDVGRPDGLGKAGERQRLPPGVPAWGRAGGGARQRPVLRPLHSLPRRRRGANSGSRMTAVQCGTHPAAGAW